jgi:ribonuclease HI
MTQPRRVIAPSQDAATDEMDRVVARGGMCVFTDGSGFEGGVGAAAVATRSGVIGVTRRLHLGEEAEHTVFESEVTGAILALDIVKATPRLTNIHIFTDCQPAITALASPKPQPGQHLLPAFHVLHRRLLRARSTLSIHFHWVPAHIGIAGNEAPDACAKEVAQGTSSPLSSRVPLFDNPLPVSKAAAIAASAKARNRRWLEELYTSPRYRRLSFFDNPHPSSTTSRMYNGLSRLQCSVLTQLRTGHIGLNAHLHRFHLAPSGDCALCFVPETVQHFLISCPTNHRHRLRLVGRLCMSRLSMKLLLSSKSDPKPVLDFARDTGRFPCYAL